MKCVERSFFTAAALVAACAASRAGATTLMRAGLEDLVAQNHTIVVGEVETCVPIGTRTGRSS